MHTALDSEVSGYSFSLPPEAIAQQPAAVRSDARMLCVTAEGERDQHVKDLPDLLRAGDLLIVNDTRVLPARLHTMRPSGGRMELLLLQPEGDGSWSALARPLSKLRPGMHLRIWRRGDGAGGPSLIVEPPSREGTCRLRTEGGASMPELLAAWGEMPLPPYIRRSDGPDPVDRERYQCLWAREDGAVAAPTAGLHFGAATLDRLDQRGVERATITLHVGEGTFKPLPDGPIGAQPLHSERYRVPVATVQAILRCEQRGGRLICVGTTSLRAVESWHRATRPADGALRETDLYLHPGDPPRVTASLITNFHLPRSSLLVLVASLLGRQRTLTLYQGALAQGYRFYSYGDCMYIA